MKKQPLKYRINVTGAALIIFLCFRTYVPIAGRRLGLHNDFGAWLLVCSLALALSCMVPVAFIEYMCDFHPFLFGKKRFDAESAAVLAHGMFMVILFSVVNSIVLMPLGKLGIVFPRQTLQQTDGWMELVLYYIFTAAVPAVVEELMIRGIVLNLLLPYGKRFAIIASAFVFMVMHTQVQSFIPVFCAGILMACIYLHSGSIYMTMALHFINNSYSFLMMYIQQEVNGISAAGFATFMIAVIIVCGIAGGLYLKKKNINYLRRLDRTAEKNAKFSSLFRSPVMILALLCCFMAIGSQLFADLGL